MEHKQEYGNVFYSHVNYSVTKILPNPYAVTKGFYSHVNYSVTKIYVLHLCI